MEDRSESDDRGNSLKQTVVNYYQDSVGSAGSARTAEVLVSLNVRMPLARAATPYLIAPGAGATLWLRGQDIRDVDMSALSVGGASAITLTLTRVGEDSVTV